jgi:hypothetical protein
MRLRNFQATAAMYRARISVQEDGPFQRGPKRRDGVQHRRLEAAVVRHVPHREVMGDQRVLHGQHGDDREIQNSPWIQAGEPDEPDVTRDQGDNEGRCAYDTGEKPERDGERTDECVRVHEL